VSDINLFAQTNFGGEGKIFGIKKEDRRRLHMYIIGKTWMRMSKPYGEFEKVFG